MVANSGLCRQLTLLSATVDQSDYYVAVGAADLDVEHHRSVTTTVIPTLTVWKQPARGIDPTRLKLTICPAAAFDADYSSVSTLFDRIDATSSAGRLSEPSSTDRSTGVELVATLRELVDSWAAGGRVNDVAADKSSSTTTEQAQRIIVDSSSSSDRLVSETIRHRKLADSMCRRRVVAVGCQDDAFNAVADYIRRKSDRPLIVVGRPGDGKTTVMSRAALEAPSWIGGCHGADGRPGQPSSTVVLRLLTRADSSASVVFDLAEHLVRRCCCVVGRPKPGSGNGIAEQQYFVGRLLCDGDVNRAVIIFLDGVDEMNLDGGSELVDWLPARLANNIKVGASKT